MKYDVIIIGDYFLDLVFTGLPTFPALGKEIFGTGFDMLPGGAYNAAVAMHRLGLRVGWAADFGEDELSRAVLAQAEAEGLDSTLFVRHDRPLRRITVALSYPEERAFVTYCDPDPPIPAAMKALATASAHAVYLAGLYAGPLLEAGLLLLRARRMKLVMDGNSGDETTLADPAVRKAIASADVFLPNAAEARRLVGTADLPTALRTLTDLGPVVAIKDGASGAYALEAGHIVHVPAIPVQPVDTTGAGDCFSAGFVKAWLDGRPLAECLRWGNIVGGLSTLARGGPGRRITAQDVEAWLARYPQKQDVDERR